MAHPLTALLPLDPAKDVTKLLAQIAEHQAELDAALANVGTVHFARIILFDRSTGDLRPTLPLSKGPFAIGIITEFDGPFDAYTQQFVDVIGFLFDLALSFTTDGASLIPVQEHVQEFAAYLKQHNLSEYLPNKNFFSAYSLTVQDILCFEESTAGEMEDPPEY